MSQDLKLPTSLSVTDADTTAAPVAADPVTIKTLPRVGRPTKSRLAKCADFLASPKIFYYLLFYLVAILVVGTVTQQELGIYGAQERYFSAWITWCLDVVPVPGGRLVLLVMSGNLMSKLLLNSRWRLNNMGVNIAHFGTLLLLIGALLTAYLSIEGSMFIREGGSSRYFLDNEQISLSVIDTSQPNVDNVMAFSGPHLRVGSLLQHSRFPGTIKIVEFHRNAKLESSAVKPEQHWRGMAKNNVIRDQQLAKDSADNHPIILIEVSGFDPQANGLHYVAQIEGPTLELSANGAIYQVVVGQRVYPLPNNMRFELLDFVAKYHPGTGKPSYFSSQLRIYENGTQREALIQMNEPLRVHGYTFYQSSFVQEDGTESTVLTVVKNFGRMFPYISSIVICIGIGLHLLLNYPAFLARFMKEQE